MATITSFILTLAGLPTDRLAELVALAAVGLAFVSIWVIYQIVMRRPK